jgi:hypothetical protein
MGVYMVLGFKQETLHFRVKLAGLIGLKRRPKLKIKTRFFNLKIQEISHLFIYLF